MLNQGKQIQNWRGKTVVSGHSLDTLFHFVNGLLNNKLQFKRPKSAIGLDCPFNVHFASRNLPHPQASRCLLNARVESVKARDFSSVPAEREVVGVGGGGSEVPD